MQSPRAACAPALLTAAMHRPQVTPRHKAAQRGVVGAVRVACRSLCPRSGLRRSLEDQVCHIWHAMRWHSPVKKMTIRQGSTSAPQWHAAAPGMHAIQAAHHFILGRSAFLQQLGYVSWLVYTVLATAVSFALCACALGTPHLMSACAGLARHSRVRPQHAAQLSVPTHHLKASTAPPADRALADGRSHHESIACVLQAAQCPSSPFDLPAPPIC